MIREEKMMSEEKDDQPQMNADDFEPRSTRMNMNRRQIEQGPARPKNTGELEFELS